MIMLGLAILVFCFFCSMSLAVKAAIEEKWALFFFNVFVATFNALMFIYPFVRYAEQIKG